MSLIKGPHWALLVFIQLSCTACSSEKAKDSCFPAFSSAACRGPQQELYWYTHVLYNIRLSLHPDAAPAISSQKTLCNDASRFPHRVTREQQSCRLRKSWDSCGFPSWTSCGSTSAACPLTPSWGWVPSLPSQPTGSPSGQKPSDRDATLTSSQRSYRWVTPPFFFFFVFSTSASNSSEIQPVLQCYWNRNTITMATLLTLLECSIIPLYKPQSLYLLHILWFPNDDTCLFEIYTKNPALSVEIFLRPRHTEREELCNPSVSKVSEGLANSRDGTHAARWVRGTAGVSPEIQKSVLSHCVCSKQRECRLEKHGLQ